MNTNFKNIKSETIRLIGLPIIYIISFYCLYRTSVFQYMEKQSGSSLVAIIIINAAAFLFILAALLTNNKIDNFVFVVLGFYLLPGVLAHSKFDWVNTLLGIKFKDNNNVSITAVLTLLVISGAIIINRITKFDKERLQWIQKGGDKGDVDEIFVKRVEIIIFCVLAVFIPVSLIVFISNMPFMILPVEPAFLAMGGTLAAILTIYLFAVIVFKKK